MTYNFPFDKLVLGQVLFFVKSLQRAIFFSKFKQGVGCFFVVFFCFFVGMFLAVLFVVCLFFHMAGSL